MKEENLYIKNILCYSTTDITQRKHNTLLNSRATLFFLFFSFFYYFFFFFKYVIFIAYISTHLFSFIRFNDKQSATTSVKLLRCRIVGGVGSRGSIK